MASAKFSSETTQVEGKKVPTSLPNVREVLKSAEKVVGRQAFKLGVPVEETPHMQGFFRSARTELKRLQREEKKAAKK